MPSRNSLKNFSPDAMYHVYNRGVDKRIIFVDERDYDVFLSFLKYALLPDDVLQKHLVVDKDIVSIAERFNLRRERLYGKVELVSFCLMPNHFHLLLYQRDIDGITKLMRSVATGYASYFNRRYKRVGPLFQGRYKAAPINNQEYWLHISRYIHLNPIEIADDYEAYPYSSYKQCIGDVHAEWVNPTRILNSFNNVEEYKEFVDSYIPFMKELKDIKDMLANSREIN